MLKNIKKEVLDEIVRTSFSYAECLRKLNMRPGGGNYKTIQLYIAKYNLDISHFTGAAWNQGERYRKIFQGRPLEVYLNNEQQIQSSKLKDKLFKAGLKENICEICHIDSWNGKEIMCELHHIDGNRNNNNLDNLMILCPNCHSQTNTFSKQYSAR